jgi:hypothetical protein
MTKNLSGKRRLSTADLFTTTVQSIVAWCFYFTSTLENSPFYWESIKLNCINFYVGFQLGKELLCSLPQIIPSIFIL